MFTGIPHTDIDAVWDEVLPWVELACKRMRGRMYPEDIKKFLNDRAMQLWTFRDVHGVAAICVTEIINYPQKKYCRIFIGSGRNRKDWQNHRKTIENWAQSEGCDGVESMARMGWGKIFDDYKQTHIVLEKEF